MPWSLQSRMAFRTAREMILSRRNSVPSMSMATISMRWLLVYVDVSRLAGGSGRARSSARAGDMSRLEILIMAMNDRPRPHQEVLRNSAARTGGQTPYDTMS